MAWSEEARAASAEARKKTAEANKATDKARSSGKAEDHDAAAAAHKTAMEAHSNAANATSPGDKHPGASLTAQEHHEKMADVHEGKAEDIRAGVGPKGSSQPKESQASENRTADVAPKSSHAESARDATTNANAATREAKVKSDYTNHNNAAQAHFAAAEAHHLAGNASAADHHSAVGNKHLEKAKKLQSKGSSYSRSRYED